jgi:hypothetical protein
MGGKPKSIHRDQVKKVTDNGSVFIYELFERKVLDITFWCNDTELSDHQTLDSTFAGNQFPFYFSISGSGVVDSLYVRGNQDFDPQELEQKARIPNFGVEVLYELHYHLEQEIV